MCVMRIVCLFVLVMLYSFVCTTPRVCLRCEGAGPAPAAVRWLGAACARADGKGGNVDVEVEVEAEADVDVNVDMDEETAATPTAPEGPVRGAGQRPSPDAPCWESRSRREACIIS